MASDKILFAILAICKNPQLGTAVASKDGSERMIDLIKRVHDEVHIYFRVGSLELHSGFM